jgi:hypothetical protein
VDPATLTALDAMVVGDALAVLPRDVQAGVLGLTVATGLWAAARPRPAALTAFAACALLWSRANSAFEVKVLWTFAPGRGLTVADLLPPVLTALILWRSRPHRTTR